MLQFQHDELLPVYRRMREHVESGIPTQADDVMRVPVSTYYDEDRFARELDEVFRKRPIPAAFSGDLREKGSYWAMTIAGVPLLLTRAADGSVRAYINACRHRGMKLVEDGRGRGRRFTCGYHAWTYSADDGRLMAIPDAESFGSVDKDCLGLTALPVEERGGLVWVVLTPGASLDLDDWLGDMAPLLDRMGMQPFVTFDMTTIDGPNWKLAMEGYLETYHFAALHPNSFNPLIYGNMAMIDTFDKHLRLCTAMRTLADHQPPAEGEWDTLQYIQHSFWFFPSLQISFTTVLPGPEPVAMALVSQVLPGTTVDTSLTIQRIITNREVHGTEMEEAVQAFADLTFATVREEDYSATPRIQQTLKSGASTEYYVGRNEIGIQHFQRGLNACLGL